MPRQPDVASARYYSSQDRNCGDKLSIYLEFCLGRTPVHISTTQYQFRHHDALLGAANVAVQALGRVRSEAEREGRVACNRVLGGLLLR